MQEGQDSYSSTFIFGNEDHTFGNPLRHILMQKVETEFCGYSVPHPYDPKLNLRLQVTNDKTSNEVLMSGLQDMEAVCNVLEARFNTALENFDNVRKQKLATKKVKK